jgi:hypothetical protein
VEQLLADQATAYRGGGRLLFDQHFTAALAALICDAVDLDLAGLETAAAAAATGRPATRDGLDAA